MSPSRYLDPHARPPDDIKQVYKRYQKLKGKALDNDPQILDLEQLQSDDSVVKIGELFEYELDKVFKAFDHRQSISESCHEPVSIYEHKDMPGLRILPALLPPLIQSTLLSRLIHRDVSNPAHQSNIHLHYEMEYPKHNASFFNLDSPEKFTIHPKDANIHKSINASQLLTKKLRWITLGGQYDWTNKVYPEGTPPRFPDDHAALLQGLFPEMKAEAAIVNFYSPGDTLSLHRDVAEECNRGLVSISIGCDGLFILGLDDHKTRLQPSAVSEADEQGDSQRSRILTIRLRSGDAVYMDGESRFAWHGVPQIIPDTCPAWLKDWPVEAGEYEQWRGWMASKRINLNVRQMWD